MIITSIENDKIKEINKLHNKKYRDLYNAYLIYGDNVLEEAIISGSVLCIITVNEGVTADFPVLIVTEKIMKKLHPTQNSINDIAIVKKQEFKALTTNRILVIDELSDPGNFGTIIRTALAFGIQGIFIGENTVELYNPKVITAAQGANFHLDFDHGDVFEYLKNSDLPIVTTFLDEENNYQKSDSFNLVIGNEGYGISDNIKTLEHSNYKIDIQYESLNVIVATGIIISNIT